MGCETHLRFLAHPLRPSKGGARFVSIVCIFIPNCDKKRKRKHLLCQSKPIFFFFSFFFFFLSLNVHFSHMKQKDNNIQWMVWFVRELWCGFSGEVRHENLISNVRVKLTLWMGYGTGVSSVYFALTTLQNELLHLKECCCKLKHQKYARTLKEEWVLRHGVRMHVRMLKGKLKNRPWKLKACSSPFSRNFYVNMPFIHYLECYLPRKASQIQGVSWVKFYATVEIHLYQRIFEHETQKYAASDLFT